MKVLKKPISLLKTFCFSNLRWPIIIVTFTSLLLAALLGLPDSPFSIIAGIRLKTEKRETLRLPASRLSALVAVNSCAESDEKSIYDNTANFTAANSGLKVFTARLAKEFDTAKKNFDKLALKALDSSVKSAGKSKTCLLPLTISSNANLSVDIPNSNLLAVALGSETLYCSNARAYLPAQTDSGKLYQLSASLADYAKHIKDKKIILKLKQLREGLRDKLSNISSINQEKRLRLEQDMRKINHALAYATYFSKDSLILGVFFDTICSQTASVATPVAQGTVIIPVATKVPAPSPLSVTPTVQIPQCTPVPCSPPGVRVCSQSYCTNGCGLVCRTPTPTFTATSTTVPGHLNAPTITNPASSTVIPISNKVTVSWNSVAGADGYLLGAVDKTDPAKDVDLLYIENYSGLTYDLTVSSDRKYRFWIRARKAAYNPNDDNTFSNLSEIIFNVQGSESTRTPTPTQSATPPVGITPPPVCSGDNSRSCNIANGQGTQIRYCQYTGWTDWEACTVSSCNPGFMISGNSCVAGDPSTPVILWPANNTIIPAGKLIVRWDPVAGATGYQIKITPQNQASYTIFNWDKNIYRFTPQENTKYSLEIFVQAPFWGPKTKVDFTVDRACQGENTEICPIANGEGNRIRKCNSGNWTDWSPCLVLSCDSGYTLSANGYSCISGTAQTPVNSCSQGYASSITQYGITWFFDQAYTCGQFANGDYWVIPKAGTNNGKVKITNINPRTGSGGFNLSHGSMINLIPGDRTTQGLYQNGGEDFAENNPIYDSSKNISLQLPIDVSPASSVYSTMNNPDTWKGHFNAQNKWILDPDAEQTFFKETAVLTVLASAPATGSFRPPYAGSDKTIRPNWNVSRIDYTKLRNLPIPVPANAPSLNSMEEATKRPLLEMHYHFLNSNWKASWTDKPGGYTRRTYGREVSGVASGAGLLLNSDLSNTQNTSLSNTLKERLAINMIQWGIDTYGLMEVGMQYQGSGGHQNGRLIPLYIAGKLLNDPQILAKARGNSPLQELLTHFFINQTHIDTQRAPPTATYPLPNKPYTQDMLGLPEWCFEYPSDPHNSSAWDPDPVWNASGYRSVNGGSNVATVAILLLMGGRQEVNHEAFFQYYINRYYPARRPGNYNAAFSSNSNGIQPFARDMWDTYISGH